MKGSVICVDKQGDKNNKSLIPFILDAIKTDGGDSLAEQLWEAEKRKLGIPPILLRPGQYETSFLNFKKQNLSEPMLKEIDNPFKYSMVALEQKQYFVYDPLYYLRYNIDPLVPE